jgi:hypothetical protein
MNKYFKNVTLNASNVIFSDKESGKLYFDRDNHVSRTPTEDIRYWYRASAEMECDSSNGVVNRVTVKVSMSEDIYNEIETHKVTYDARILVDLTNQRLRIIKVTPMK